MENRNTTIAYVAGYVAVVVSALTFLGIGIFTFVHMTLDGIAALFDGRLDGSKMALMIIATLFVLSAVYVRNNWKQRVTYIFVKDNNPLAEAADRRDEFYEASL